jgi:hypothetical protein
LPYFENVPLEIRLLILDYLPTQSAICLSLTPKYQYQKLGSRIDLKFSRRTCNTEAGKRFIKLILPDIPPKWIHCHYCNKLFRWQSSWFYVYYTVRDCPHFDEHHIENCEEWQYSLNSLHGGLTQTAIEAHVRAYELGSPNSPPLATLEHNYST